MDDSTVVQSMKKKSFLMRKLSFERKRSNRDEHVSRNIENVSLVGRDCVSSLRCPTNYCSNTTNSNSTIGTGYREAPRTICRSLLPAKKSNFSDIDSRFKEPSLLKPVPNDATTIKRRIPRSKYSANSSSDTYKYKTSLKDADCSSYCRENVKSVGTLKVNIRENISDDIALPLKTINNTSTGRSIRLSRKPSIRSLLSPFKDEPRTYKKDPINVIDDKHKSFRNEFSGWKSQRARTQPPKPEDTGCNREQKGGRRKRGVVGLFNFNIGGSRDGLNTYKSFADIGDSMDSGSVSSVNNSLSRSTVGSNPRKCIADAHVDSKNKKRVNYTNEPKKFYNVFRNSVRNTAKENILQKATNKLNDWHNNGGFDKNKIPSSRIKFNKSSEFSEHIPKATTIRTHGNSFTRNVILDNRSFLRDAPKDCVAKSGIPVLSRSTSPDNENKNSNTPTQSNSFQLSFRRSRQHTRETPQHDTTFSRTARAVTRRTRIPSPVSRGLTETNAITDNSFSDSPLRQDEEFNFDEKVLCQNNSKTFETRTPEELLSMRNIPFNGNSNLMRVKAKYSQIEQLPKPAIKSSLRKGGREKLKKVSVRFLDQESNNREVLSQLHTSTNDLNVLSVSGSVVKNVAPENYKLFYNNYRRMQANNRNSSRTVTCGDGSNSLNSSLFINEGFTDDIANNTPIKNIENFHSFNKSCSPNLPRHANSMLWNDDLEASHVHTEGESQNINRNSDNNTKLFGTNPISLLENTEIFPDNQNDSFSSYLGMDELSNLSSSVHSSNASVSDNQSRNLYYSDRPHSLKDRNVLDESSTPSKHMDSVSYNEFICGMRTNTSEVDSSVRLSGFSPPDNINKVDHLALYSKPKKRKSFENSDVRKTEISSPKKRNSEYESSDLLSDYVNQRLLHKQSREELDSSDITLRSIADKECPDKVTPCRLSQLFIDENISAVSLSSSGPSTRQPTNAHITDKIQSQSIFQSSVVNSSVINSSASLCMDSPSCGDRRFPIRDNDTSISCSNINPIHSMSIKQHNRSIPISIRRESDESSVSTPLHFGHRTSLNNLVEEYCGDISIDDFADLNSCQNDYHLDKDALHNIDNVNYASNRSTIHPNSNLINCSKPFDNSRKTSPHNIWQNHIINERHSIISDSRSRGAFVAESDLGDASLSVLSADKNSEASRIDDVDSGVCDSYRGLKLPSIFDNLISTDSDNSGDAFPRLEDGICLDDLEKQNTRIKREFERLLLDYDMPKSTKMKKTVKFNLER